MIIEMTQNCIFFCQTAEGYIIQNLSELLKNNSKTGCFIVSKNGINFCMMDSNRHTTIDLELMAENFSQYKFKGKTPLSIGLNLSHFYQMCKNIKKKDSIALFIDEDDETQLKIRVFPKEKTRITTSSIKIQNLQSLDVELPSFESYSKPIIIPSGEYTKMIKDACLGETINISSNTNTARFKCDTSGVYNRDIVFGDEDYDDEDVFSQEFDTDRLTRISKIAGLNPQMQLFQGENLPIVYKSGVGSIGKIAVYIKDNTQVENST